MKFYKFIIKKRKYPYLTLDIDINSYYEQFKLDMAFFFFVKGI